MQETGYAVNQVARSLRRRTTGTIVVLVPNIGNQFFSRILAGIESAASRAGYTVLISDTRPLAGGGMLMDFVRNNRADGLISLDGVLPRQILPAASAGRRTPTLVFCAADDRLTPLYFSQELLARIPGARLLVAEKGGHAHSQTMPEEFNSIVLQYLLGQEACRSQP